MKQGFYMGYDASRLGEDALRRQARLLLDTGLYRAGYRTLRLGRVERFDAPEKLAASLRALGFQLDFTVAPEAGVDGVAERIQALGAGMLTIDGSDREAARNLAAAFAGKLRVAVAAEDAAEWAGDCADVAELNVIREDDDFFEITRNRLDSCRDGDTDVARSDANLRRAAMGAGGAWSAGNLPLRFDMYRNQAIFMQAAILGCPLVLAGDIAELPGETLALLTCEPILRIAKAGLGGVARYYDPWHALLTKPARDGATWALILNRCHGDQPTNLLPADLGWEGRFSLRQLPEDRLVGANLETFEAHLETSDHPETPCCGLYLAERI